MSKYYNKRNDSFKTRYKLFLFEMAFKRVTLEKLVSNNKDIINDFKMFKIDQDIIDAYATQYYQKEYDEEVKYKDYKELTVDEIWKSMQFGRSNLFELTDDKHRKNISGKYLRFYNNLKESYDGIFKKLFSEEKFKEMENNEVCSYCGISVDDIKLLGNEHKLYNKRSETRGYTLEIDRKEANQEYTEENCCMSCYWCNNAKTDEFRVDEFKEIARGINLVWQKRLGNKKIVFPDKSDIWIP